MKKTQATRQNNNIEQATLYIAFELSDKNWKLAFSDGSRERLRGVDADEKESIWEEIEKSKEHFGLGDDVRVVSCYEAGRDGFWLHRYLESHGVENLVVDPSSIEVNRRKRRAKTDRLDAKKLLKLLMRYCWGDEQAWRVVRVPGVEEEDERHLHRELQSLKKERTMHSNRIRSFLKLHGIRIDNPRRTDFKQYLDSVRLWDGSELGSGLKDRLKREYERMEIVQSQIKTLEKERVRLVRLQETESMRRIGQMMALRGIGIESSWLLEKEFFGWRRFCNRKEVGALSGLSPTPYSSGKSGREQGINKEGNCRVRVMMIEISWSWLRNQPESKLSKWFNERYAEGGKRMRRIGIVAVARRLLIDIWRFLEHGVVPEGAIVE
jgi:transposase